ncbi:helix-turn-helix domain-containing protein [Sphingomonas sp. R86520]|uniref:helix-turn-helix domain-containing protein n=1 Tax=Sphingomonas sp. R86520 TaxID=3093859 RepID=UPI0036D42189
MDKREVGRPTSFKPEFVEQARKLASLGATDREAAEFFEVAESTLYLWKHTQPEFSEALKVGKETADARVEQSLYRRALGYSHDAVKIMMADGVPIVEPYVEHYPPDTTAAIFWLKNRKPEQWRDKTTVEHELPKDMGAWLGER